MKNEICAISISLDRMELNVGQVAEYLNELIRLVDKVGVIEGIKAWNVDLLN